MYKGELSRAHGASFRDPSTIVSGTFLGNTHEDLCPVELGQVSSCSYCTGIMTKTGYIKDTLLNIDHL